MEFKAINPKTEKSQGVGVDFSVENFGNFIVVHSSEGRALRLNGGLEIKRINNEQCSFLVSLDKEGLHAAYIPGVDIFRIGKGVLSDFEKDPLIADRVFAHEAAHRRFFQSSKMEQATLADGMYLDNPEAFQRLTHSFYNSRLGKSYAGVHGHDFNVGDFLTKGKKSGLRDDRVFQLTESDDMRLGLFVTEMLSYMSPLFLPNGQLEFEKEAAGYKDPVSGGSFFENLYRMYTVLMDMPDRQKIQYTSLFRDASPQSLSVFRQFIADVQKKQKRQ